MLDLKSSILIFKCACGHKSAVVCGAQKREFSPLELEIEAVVRHPLRAQKAGLGSSGKVASALKHWTISPVPIRTWSKTGL